MKISTFDYFMMAVLQNQKPKEKKKPGIFKTMIVLYILYQALQFITESLLQ